MPFTTATNGCLGPVALVHIQGFLVQNDQNKIKIHMLTQTEKNFSCGVETMLGNMMKLLDVSQAMEGVDVAFLLVP